MLALFDASTFLDLHRLPELFCGFERRPGEGPTLYPVACSPQAWSAAAVFCLLEACLGLTVRAVPGQVLFSYPLLPPALKEVEVLNLRVGNAAVELATAASRTRCGHQRSAPQRPRRDPDDQMRPKIACPRVSIFRLTRFFPKSVRQLRRFL